MIHEKISWHNLNLKKYFLDVLFDIIAYEYCVQYIWEWPIWLEVCVLELGTERDETGRDWRPFPNCQDRDGTRNVWSCCSGKFGKNSGRDGTGLLGTTREKS